MIDVKPLIVATYIQENTTINPYRCVGLGTSAEQVIANASTSAMHLGVADESADATTGNPVGVILLGIAKLCIAASGSAKGGAITGTTGGKGLVTTTGGQYCVGWLLKTTTATDELAPVLVNPFIYAIT